jgi:hypothetical protein
VRTLQDWEQGRRAPSGAARTLLLVVAKNPRALLDVAWAESGSAARPRRDDTGSKINPTAGGQHRTVGRWFTPPMIGHSRVQFVAATNGSELLSEVIDLSYLKVRRANRLGERHCAAVYCSGDLHCGDVCSISRNCSGATTIETRA